MMRKSTALLAILFVLTCSVPPLLACLWDYDTLAVERARFPDTLELITGKFLHHSEEFYRWRIADRQKRLEANPSDLRLYDDLAVAYDKVGDQAQAIKMMQQSLERNPDRYETLANLGTFHIHSGDFEKGVEFIGRAIQVNPDAHFGREVYQKLLVEYVLAQRQEDASRLPLTDDKPNQAKVRIGFAAFVLKAVGDPQEKEARIVEVRKAIKGVLGMMRFGHYDSPILLEALGDLLMARGYEGDGKRLAARAYLKASYETKGKSQQAYRGKATTSLGLQTIAAGTTKALKIDALEAQFAAELKQAQTWYDAVRQDEKQWIAAGVDVDKEFSRKYYAPPKVDAVASGVKTKKSRRSSKRK